MNGKMDLAQAESVADIIAAGNEASHRLAMMQMRGGFSSELKKMRDELLQLVTLMELELDFSEEDVQFADRTALTALPSGFATTHGGLRRVFAPEMPLKTVCRQSSRERRMPGKALCSIRCSAKKGAIVSEQHGTTRDTIEECLNIDGMLFRFIDTAGLRESAGNIEKKGIERTFEKIGSASVVLAVMDYLLPFPSFVGEF